MSKIYEAEAMSANNTKLKITLSNKEVIVGHSMGIEPAFDNEGEELDYDVLVFDALFPDAYFRLKEEDIEKVEKAS